MGHIWHRVNTFGSLCLADDHKPLSVREDVVAISRSGHYYLDQFKPNPDISPLLGLNKMAI
jgi:hypothetical protein